MNIIEGKDLYSEGTGPCDLYGCIYNECGKCIYDIAILRSSISKACDSNIYSIRDVTIEEMK